MPFVLLSDLARMRFQVISFFLVVFILCAKAVQWIWNALTTDFPRIPRLTYGKAIGLVTLWGLLFLLVLTMISGARELMTPGAWKKQGFTYTLASDPESPDPSSARTGEREAPEDDANYQARRDGLVRLSIGLWTYGQNHEGLFPSSADAPEIAEPLWRVPDAGRLRYIYIPGLKRDQGSSPLAYEPGLHGPERWVLLTDGQIKRMTLPQIQSALRSSADGHKAPAQTEGKEQR
jgi:hypothetical protein